MDMLAVASSVSATSQQVSSSSRSTSNVQGSTSFDQQLTQFVNQSSSNEQTAAVETPVNTEVVSEVVSGSPQLTAQDLLSLIESLIGLVEELMDAPLTEENQQDIEDINLELLALLQLVTVDNKELISNLEQFVQSNSAMTMSNAQGQVNNELLFNLQEQLILLQQSLKDGQVKVVQGQQPEQLITQVIQKVEKLLDELAKAVKSNLVTSLSAQLENQADAEVSVETLKNSTLDQLKQLAKQSEYAQLANQTQTSTQQTVVTNEEAVPNTQVQATTPLQLHTQSSSLLGKSQFQAPSFTMVTQFADTVKDMVVQKFNLVNLNGISEARIMLTPENLGSVDVKLSMQNGILTAVFQAETASAKDALENQMAVLRSSLAAQGITVERLEVTQASFTDEMNWQEQRQNQQSLNESSEDNLEDENFEEQLENHAAIQDLGVGRSVNEIA